MDRSNPDIILRCAIASLMTGVEHAARLYEQQLHLLLGKRLVFHPSWCNEHLTFRNPNRTVPKVDPQFPIHDDECLVCVLVVMPEEVSFQLHELELVIVHLGNNFGLPPFIEQSELLLEIDGSIFHGAPLSAALVLPVPSHTSR